ncbi:helix-turn-helix domain-containing protein [Epilithonimonas caeni]|uniref:helix-turn-helix domain-containing protein n=1 Tax=Epilithonimonas caeni TaxID=365343 RepID=UPI00040BDCCC|nr:AraC family transcriptional regulator [Epilithonimonas caeni]
MKLILTVFLVIGTIIKAQNSRDAETLFLESKDLLYKKPSESAVISEFLSKNSSDDNDKIKALLLLTESYLIRGDYNSASETLFQCLELSKKSNRPENESQINFLLARLCDELGIEFSQLYLIKDEKEITQNYYEKAIKSYSDSNWHQTIKDLKLFEKQKNKSFPELSNFYYALSYSNLGKLDSARYYAQKIKNYEPYYFYTKAKIESSGKESDKTIDHLEYLKPINKKVQDIWLRNEIYNWFVENYDELKNKEKYREYYQLQTAFQDSLSTVKENARISFLNKIGQKQDEILETKAEQQIKMIYLIAIAVLLVFTVAYFFNRKLNRKRNDYEKSRQEAEDREKFIAENKAQESGGKIVIPDKTISFLLEKLEKFESNNEYLDPAISLNLLAENLNTNTKYLSEIINTYKNKNFHSYINELRINYIISKLKNDPVYLKYKVSHLAQEAGFSSHSLFSTVFKQVTGHSPASFIKTIKNQ